MIVFTEAVKLAATEIDAIATGSRHKLLISDCQSHEEGWFFFYQTSTWFETGLWTDLLGGNWPVFVSRTGEVSRTSSEPEQFLRELNSADEDEPRPMSIDDTLSP